MGTQKTKFNMMIFIFLFSIQSIVAQVTPEDTFLCQDNYPTVHDLNGNGNNYRANSISSFQCKVSVEQESDSFKVTTNGIPNHDFESTLGCCTTEVAGTWHLPKTPVVQEGDKTMAPTRGAVAVAVNGVPIFGPEEGPGGDAVALHFDYFDEDRQPIALGLGGGHSAGSTYHYHWNANIIHWNKGSQQWSEYTDNKTTEIATPEHSKIIGYAFDGYPIYGAFGYMDIDTKPNEGLANANVRLARSSYRLKAGQRGYGGINDWQYIDGLGDLDKCNGRFGPTPEYPDGIYHYHSSLINGDNGVEYPTTIGFPYFLLCYHGVVDETNLSGDAANMMGPPDGMMMGNGLPICNAGQTQCQDGSQPTCSSSIRPCPTPRVCDDGKTVQCRTGNNAATTTAAPTTAPSGTTLPVCNTGQNQCADGSEPVCSSEIRPCPTRPVCANGNSIQCRIDNNAGSTAQSTGNVGTGATTTSSVLTFTQGTTAPKSTLSTTDPSSPSSPTNDDTTTSSSSSSSTLQNTLTFVQDTVPITQLQASNAPSFTYSITLLMFASFLMSHL